MYTELNKPVIGSGDLLDITFQPVEGVAIRTAPIYVAEAKLHDKYGRDFISSLGRTVKRQTGVVTLTDVPEVEENYGPELKPVVQTPISKPALYSIGVRVMDGNKALVGVSIQTDGNRVTTTDNLGYAAISQLVEGDYAVTATKVGYTFEPQTCTVGNQTNCTIVFTTNADEVGKYAIYGTVFYKNGEPIVGAIVKIGQRNTITDETGYFAIVGLVEGQYQVTARKGTENLGEETCVVGGDSNCKLDFYTHLDQNPPEQEPGEVAIYGLQINAIDQERNPIAGVLLQVGNQSVITDENGYGEIIELTEGEYTLIASKEGLQFKDQTVAVGNQQLWTKLVVKPLTELKAKIAPTVGGMAEQGKHFSYLITVNNEGSETATGVSFEYQLPVGTELVEIRGVDAGACEPVTDDNLLVCSLPDLVSGESVEIGIELDIVQPDSTLVNTVTLNSNEYPVVVVKVQTIVKPYLSVFCKGTPNPIHTKEGAIVN